jgi:putative flippase GtrA
MTKKIVAGKTNNAYIQLLRYLIGGGIAFVVDVSILWVLTEHAHLHYLISSTISFTIGLLISYLFSVTWVFDEKRIERRTVEIMVFAAIGGVGLLLTSLFMWFFTSVLLIYYFFSKILASGIVFGWNFIAKKRIIFTKK